MYFVPEMFLISDLIDRSFHCNSSSTTDFITDLVGYYFVSQYRDHPYRNPGKSPLSTPSTKPMGTQRWWVIFSC